MIEIVLDSDQKTHLSFKARKSQGLSTLEFQLKSTQPLDT